MFTGEVDCTYFFTWDTRYACVKEKEDLLCSVTDGKKRLRVFVPSFGVSRHPALRRPGSASLPRLAPRRCLTHDRLLTVTCPDRQAWHRYVNVVV